MNQEDISRQLHAYCVGQAKSGTASLCGACGRDFRAAHEPERSDLLAKVLLEAEGSISAGEVAGWLRERDERLQLDVDISWCNYFVLDHLLTCFPDARFVVLVRDCYTWMESVIGHMLTRDIPADARAFMEFWFRTADHPHGAGEQRLRDAGLFSLAAYLETWRDHITRCVERIPADRLLVLRTHELGASLPALVRHLGVSVDRLNAEDCHLNKGTWRGHLGELVDLGVVEDSVAQWCGEAMREYFPEVDGIDDAYALWSDMRRTC